MLLQQKQVAIIGGGPGGLTLARLLQLQGVAVKVYERDSDKNVRVQGAPLDLHQESGLKAIQQAGLMSQFQQNFMPTADRKKIMNQAGEVIYSDHATKLVENFASDDFRPEIDRGVLREILLVSLQPDTVQWDSYTIALTPQQHGWQLQLQNGSTAYADFVVVCDGANSKLRHYVSPVQPFYTGITMLEGNIAQADCQSPAIFERLQGGKIMAFGDNQNILMGQKANHEIGYYLSFRTGADWQQDCPNDMTDKQAVLRWYDQYYADWDKQWRAIIEDASYDFIARPIYCMPVDQTWQPHANITLLGDAAHVMPPFAGEGVNMAMLDAVELSHCLTQADFPDLLTAVTAYESQMRQRAGHIAQYSLDNGEKMHSKEALSTMLAFFDVKAN